MRMCDWTFFFCKSKPADGLRMRDWSSDVRSPGLRTQHLPPPAVEPDMGADRVHHVERQRLLEFPRPRCERIWLRRQRAHRAQIDHVARKLALVSVLEIGRDLHVLAAPDRADILDAGDFLGKTDAARALEIGRASWRERECQSV